MNEYEDENEDENKDNDERYEGTQKDSGKRI